MKTGSRAVGFLLLIVAALGVSDLLLSGDSPPVVLDLPVLVETHVAVGGDSPEGRGENRAESVEPAKPVNQPEPEKPVSKPVSVKPVPVKPVPVKPVPVKPVSIEPVLVDPVPDRATLPEPEVEPVHAAELSAPASNEAEGKEAGENRAPTVPRLSMPFTGDRVSPSPPQISRRDLSAQVSRVLGRPALKKANVGICLIDVATNEIIYRRNADEYLCPASNAKIFTSLAALRLLGADFVFETRLLAKGPIDEKGVLHGDLVVIGDGDPDPADEARGMGGTLIERLVAEVKRAGIRKIDGRVVIDDRVFDRDFISPAWNAKRLSKAYQPPVSGFSQSGNLITVNVTPGKSVGELATVSLEPGGRAFALESRVRTGSSKAKNLIDIQPNPVKPGKVKVQGETPLGARVLPIQIPVSDPVLVSGTLLVAELEAAGIQVKEGPVLVEAGGAALSRRGEFIGTVRTPLGVALMAMNKTSQNGVAEHLFKRVGAALEDQGSFSAGGRAVEEALRRVKVPRGRMKAVDGSGLARSNRYSARQVANSLVVLYRADYGDMFVKSLPEAGVDGTLRTRFTEAEYRGRVRAKTGWITNVAALSGYVQTDQGRVLAFSILANEFKVSYSQVKSILDAVARLFVDLDVR